MNTSVKSGSSRVMRIGLAAIGGVVMIGLIAPFISAGRFSGRIQQALEDSLGRKVHFSKVRFTLFSGPGFALEDVTIDEDPHYGLEPFAYVTTLNARLRLDKLLLGRMAFANLQLIDPSLNLVKRSDGTWNAIELIERFTAPRRAPLNLFPAMNVLGARIDFKFGARKTALYIADADLTIYPEHSGKLYIRFSGSPARTDRAGNGFGHLRGAATWSMNARGSKEKELQADVILDPSNLSEMTTLVEGHDAGVHGTVSSHASIEGPLTNLRVSGELHLDDVHRWDLLPSSGETLRIRYRGDIDLLAHRFDVETFPLHPGETTPVALQVRVADFLTRPTYSIFVRLDKAPVEGLLPLSRRMGLTLPQDVKLQGALDGVIGYSNTTGLLGGIVVNDLTASLPNGPPLTAPLARANISADSVHFEPAAIQTPTGDTLYAGGDYAFSGRQTVISLKLDGFPVTALKNTVNAWSAGPSALALFDTGNITGELVYREEEKNLDPWSGQFQIAAAKFTPPGFAVPLDHVEGRISFDNSTFDLSRFTADLGGQVVHGSYHYNALAKRPGRIHIDVRSADLSQIEAALDPTLRAQGLLARLRFTHRAIPPWLAARNLEGDLNIGRFSLNNGSLGPFSAHFLWQGANVQVTSVQLNLTEGQMRANGTVDLTSYSPRYRFAAKVDAFPWRGGLLNGDGEFETYGTGAEILQHLHATGTFSGEDLSLSADDNFSRVSGLFDLSFANGWPDLHLSNIQASDGEDAWNGEAASQSDGKLVLDLEHAGRQRRVISSLVPETPAVSSSVVKIARR